MPLLFFFGYNRLQNHFFSEIFRKRESTPVENSQPIELPPVYQDSVEFGRILLRDGSVAAVRIAQPSDKTAVEEFFTQLTEETLSDRFLGGTNLKQVNGNLLNGSERPDESLALLVTRTIKGSPRIIAIGAYFKLQVDKAEIALAVDEEFHGLGIGSVLFERITVLAERQGFHQVVGFTHTDNPHMLEVFRHSGYDLSESRDGDRITVTVSLIPTKDSAARAEKLDRLFTVASLTPFFHPKTVAVIGASRKPKSIGHRILNQLLENGFQGKLYPVNPQADEISGVKCYPTTSSIPEPVDLAVIVVPNALVLDVVDDCAKAGVPALIVISAGFAEVSGGEGAQLQAKLVDKVRGYGMRMLGPNCLGMLTTEKSVSMNASFSPVFPNRGNIAMLSQSGALGIAILAMAKNRGLGMSSFLSIGNKADISGNDLLQFWEQDPNTGVILLYLESFKNPRRFMQLARRVGKRKPILVVKGGRTGAGQRAAGSHTAALAASDTAVEALMHQSGVIRVASIEELFDVAELLSMQPLPKGKKVGIVTNAGGPGILCTDACVNNGLDVVKISDALSDQIAERLPSAAGLSNPVDMIASATPEEYAHVIRCMLASDEIDALIVIYITVGVTDPDEVVEGIKKGIREGREAGALDKPVISCFMGESQARTEIALEDEHIPTYKFPESAAIALGEAAQYARWRRKKAGSVYRFSDADTDQARAICRRAVEARGEGWLSAQETLDLGRAMGLPFSAGGVAQTADEAVDIAQEVGFPVVVKLASTTIVHKTEHNAVRLNLPDAAAVRDAFNGIRESLQRAGQLDAMDGVVVQPMLKSGLEIMTGVVDDPAFGPLIAFGMGGVHVEVLKDVSFRLSPLSDHDVREMVREIRGYRLLKGYRGKPPADIEAIQELLLRISLLLESVDEVVELDLNPIMAFEPGKGCSIVDARIRVKSPSSGSESNATEQLSGAH